MVEILTYNNSHKVTKYIEAPSQEEIYNCPYYFGMSYEQVKASGAPSFLINLLDQFPWDGRKTICQIRPQDFRVSRPNIDGAFWHSDENVRLITHTQAAESLFDMHLMVISWGGVCSTEFIKTPMEMPNHWEDPQGHVATLNWYLNKGIETELCPDSWMMEYTSLDLHRAALTNTVGAFRLMCVVFDCNNIVGNVRILPSIRQQEGR